MQLHWGGGEKINAAAWSKAKWRKDKLFKLQNSQDITYQKEENTSTKNRDVNVDVLKGFHLVEFAIMKINIRYKLSFIWFHLGLNNHWKADVKIQSENQATC